MNHFADSSPIASKVARKVEKHAAVAVEQVRRSSQSPIRTRGCGMHDHIETVGVEVFAHRLFLQQIQFGGRGRQHLIRGGELLRQISSNETRSAGDEYARCHYDYAGDRKENFLCPRKLYSTM